MTPSKRNSIFGSTIRVVDLVVYLAICAGGIASLLQVDYMVIRYLPEYQVEWVKYLWAYLLLIGGAVGFVGRLTRLWLVEVPATVAAMFGTAVFVVILGSRLVTDIGYTTSFALGFAAFAFMVRRWLELQMLASEPGSNWRTRLSEAVARKTTNAVRH